MRRQLPPPGLHGGDGPAVARALGVELDQLLDLSQSLNPVAPDPRPIVAAHLDALGRYPDSGAAHAALATRMGVDPGRLLLTNGGAEAITLVSRQLGGSVVEPEFSLHPRGDGPRWRSNPQNPTGRLAAPEERAAVWDEAFYPLATGRWTRGDEGAAVVGSLTKLLSCPGLRVGYVLAGPDLVRACRADQPTWSLNGLAAASLADLLAPLDIERDAREVRVLRGKLRELLEGRGLRVRPSDANWLLVERGGLRSALARESVLVRDCASFGLTDVARIAVPTPEGLGRLAAALDRLEPWLRATSPASPQNELTTQESERSHDEPDV